jgi:HAD superfamily hydrolase (TIGR01509 family)
VSEIDAVVFDLGNVLLRFDDTIARDRMAARTGKTAGEIEAYFWGTPHATHLSLGKMTGQRFYRTVSNDLGFDGEYEEFAAIWSEIFTPVEPMMELAASLATRLPRMILSNTNAIHMHYISETYPAIQEFDAQILSHEVGLLKPDREIYELTLRHGGLEAGRTLFIDDLPANVEGARAAGMLGLQFMDAGQVRQELTKLGVPSI